MLFEEDTCAGLNCPRVKAKKVRKVGNGWTQMSLQVARGGGGGGGQGLISH